MDPRVLAAFEETQTDDAKGPLSATAEHQAADVSVEFENIKAGVSYVNSHNINVHNKVLRHNLEDVFWPAFGKFLIEKTLTGVTVPTAAKREKNSAWARNYRLGDEK